MSSYYQNAGNVIDRAFLQKLETLDLSIRQAMNGRMIGARRSKKEGSSLEWMDYSEYSPGDDYRRVDWNLAARFDKLYIRHFVGEQQLQTNVYLDMSASMDWPDGGRKGLMALRVAAALAYLSVRHMDRAVFNLMKGSRCEKLCGTVVGLNSFYQATNLLSTVDFTGDTDLNAAIRSDPVPGYENGVSYIISDFMTDSDWQGAVNYLLSRRRQVGLIQLLAPEEMAPSYGGFLSLLDVELAQPQDAPMRERIDRSTLEAYRRARKQWQQEMADFCASRNVAYMCMSSDEPLEHAFLKKGARAGVIR